MLKQVPTYSSLKDMTHLLVLYVRIARITFSISFQRLSIERSRHGYMLIEFQKLIMKPMVMSGRNGIQYRWVMYSVFHIKHESKLVGYSGSRWGKVHKYKFISLMGRISGVDIFASKCHINWSMGIRIESNSEHSKYSIKRKRNRKFESTSKVDALKRISGLG
uniref:Uncharacterized protein n=1 Tax=Helianthus annuus TaxID=4232 RepID=A0A251UQN7_HELAN